ncbi:HPP family protein [Haloplanus aerogenes]|uniref:HPP family protein n=1 Tax=Haloplanus aerogenes TaxID=660522 RepID=A0A3G8R0H1_9EURY|nr:HPP family protein [Haloplanus aerogenes]
MSRHRLGTSCYAGVLFTVLGAVAWLSGQPFVFPSLGPSAFLLAFERRGDRSRLFRVVASHAIGGVAGLLAYTALGAGATLTATPPGSAAGLHLVASGICSIVLTSWGMIATDTNHAPACATTLIVSLGLLSTPMQVATIVVSVVVLVVVHGAVVAGFERVVGDTHPRYAD